MIACCGERWEDCELKIYFSPLCVCVSELQEKSGLRYIDKRKGKVAFIPIWPTLIVYTINYDISEV